MDGPGVARLDPYLVDFLDEVSLDRTQVAVEIVSLCLDAQAKPRSSEKRRMAKRNRGAVPP